MCSDSGKKYKTRGRYQRHRAAKDSPNLNEHRLTLTPSILAEIVRNALKNIYQREVFAEELREELKQYEYAVIEEGTQEFSVMKALFEGYSKNGNAEKFYGNYYAQVPMKSPMFFKGLSRNAATLLATKVADFTARALSLLPTITHLQPKLCCQKNNKLVCSMFVDMSCITCIKSMQEITKQRTNRQWQS